MNNNNNFKHVAEFALRQAETLVRNWLPGGLTQGNEYSVLNPTRTDGRKGSFSINLQTGVWADFATEDKGGDLIALYAYLFNCSQKQALYAVAKAVGYCFQGSGQQNTSVTNNKGKWQALPFVPKGARAYPVTHFARGKPQYVWEYRNREGVLHGVVMCFQTPDGGKEIIPCVWAKHKEKEYYDWRWLSFLVPRPLYLATPKNECKPVLIVEGEKCADAAASITALNNRFDVVTWPGGCKAIDKADWSILKNRECIIWPDLDRKLDKAGRLLPAHKQPGMVAAFNIQKILADQGCSVQFVPVTDTVTSTKKAGWDIADAIEEGMPVTEILKLIDTSKAIPIQQNTAQKNNQNMLTDYDVELFVSRPNWVLDRGQPSGCLANVSEMLKKHRQWQGVLKYNEFSDEIDVCLPPPYAAASAPWKGQSWTNEDDVQTTIWLQQAGIPASISNVTPAIKTVAKMTPWHPIRKWLSSLKWDGKPRLNTWLTDYVGAASTCYTEAVASFFLIGMVKRVFEPGCKFDYALILEGPQGVGKSTVFSVLAGEWFSDAELDLYSKDSMTLLAGHWLHEFAELTSISKADQNKIKSFLTRQVDEYRPVYERRNVRVKRQIVFGGTTNEREYFDDPTGARRFWPVLCKSPLNIQGLKEAREQLFAEAYARYIEGERCYPTPTQQKEWFDPQQIRRQHADPLEELIREFIEEKQNSFNQEFTMNQLLKAVVNKDPSKWQKGLPVRIGKLLTRLGCVKEERRLQQQRHVYKPPKKTAIVTEDCGQHERGAVHEIPIEP